jgi:integrase/recombinase XerD
MFEAMGKGHFMRRLSKEIKRDTTFRELKTSLGGNELEKLIAVAKTPRDKAFVSVLGKTGMSISETIQLNVTDIDSKRGTLTIAHLKERVKLKCPNCGELLGKRHLFCCCCGKRVDQAIREKVEQRRQRIIPVDHDTLRLLDEYLKWRRKFPYRGPLVFPFTRQRGWQLIEKLGRRAGIKGLHPRRLRRNLAMTWVANGLDTKKLQILLGYASVATPMENVDSNFEQLRSECQKLWGPTKDEERPE